MKEVNVQVEEHMRGRSKRCDEIMTMADGVGRDVKTITKLEV